MKNGRLRILPLSRSDCAMKNKGTAWILMTNRLQFDNVRKKSKKMLRTVVLVWHVFVTAWNWNDASGNWQFDMCFLHTYDISLSCDRLKYWKIRCKFHWKNISRWIPTKLTNSFIDKSRQKASKNISIWYWCGSTDLKCFESVELNRAMEYVLTIFKQSKQSFMKRAEDRRSDMRCRRETIKNNKKPPHRHKHPDINPFSCIIHVFDLTNFPFFVWRGYCCRQRRRRERKRKEKKKNYSLSQFSANMTDWVLLIAI